MTSASGLGAGLDPGAGFPDFTLPDHAGNGRRLSDLVGDDPTVLQFFRGWWCPKEQEFFRRMLRVQHAAQVAYSRLISVSVDAPLVKRPGTPSAPGGMSIHSRGGSSVENSHSGSHPLDPVERFADLPQ